MRRAHGPNRWTHKDFERFWQWVSIVIVVGVILLEITKWV
jgi:hypothetical protein